MPCNALAVARARLEPNVGAEIVGSQQAIEALRRWLSHEVGSKATLQTGPVSYGRHSSRVLPFGWVKFTVDGYEVTLFGNGELSIEGRYATRAELAALQAKVEPFVQQLARASARERLLQKLRTGYSVLSEEKATAGARVLTLSL